MLIQAGLIPPSIIKIFIFRTQRQVFPINLNNHIDYSQLKFEQYNNEKHISLIQNYGISIGNFSFHGESFVNKENQSQSHLGLRQLFVINHKNGHYAQSGMLALPTVNNINQRNMLGFMAGNDRQTINNGLSQGSPIILNIEDQSHVVIRNSQTNQLIFVSNLYPGTQQINTSHFLTGIYPINIKITNSNGQVTTVNRLFIKNSDIPILGHPNYDIAVGWLETIDSNNTNQYSLPKYDMSHPSLFGNFNAATSYNSAMTFGAFLYDKDIVASVMHHLYDANYLFTISTTASSDNSYGIASTLVIPKNQYLNFYSQAYKTWGANNRYFLSTYQFNMSVQLNWLYHQFHLSTAIGFSTEQDQKSITNYYFGISRKWSFLASKHSAVALQLDLGKDSSQGVFAQLIFHYGYLNGLNQLALNTYSASYNPFTGTNTPSTIPSIYGITGYQHADRQLMLSSTISYLDGVQSNTGLNYKSNGLLSSNNFITSPVATNFTTSTDIGFTGNDKMIAMANMSQSMDSSGIMIRIDAPTSVKYQILINGLPYGVGLTDQNNFIQLDAFQSYSISIIPMNVSYSLPEKNYSITLYPGNIEDINLTLLRKIIVITELDDSDHMPISGATYINKLGEFFNSNELGNIQFSAFSDQKIISFKLKNHQQCQVTLPTFRNQMFFYKKHMLCQ